MGLPKMLRPKPRSAARSSAAQPALLSAVRLGAAAERRLVRSSERRPGPRSQLKASRGRTVTIITEEVATFSGQMARGWPSRRAIVDNSDALSRHHRGGFYFALRRFFDEAHHLQPRHRRIMRAENLAIDLAQFSEVRQILLHV